MKIQPTGILIGVGLQKDNCFLFSYIITHGVISKIRLHSDSFGTHSCLGLNTISGVYVVQLSPSLQFQTVQRSSELLAL